MNKKEMTSRFSASINQSKLLCFYINIQIQIGGSKSKNLNTYIMKSLINSVRLMGHVGATPAVKSFDNGNKVAKLILATNERQKNAKGETIAITHWHNLVFWGKQAELIEKYIGKGERIAIEGTLANRSYETKTGDKKQITEVRVDSFEFVSRKTQTANASKGSDVADDLPF